MLILFSECSSAVSLTAGSALSIGRTAPGTLGSSRTFANPKTVSQLLVKIIGTFNLSTVSGDQSDTSRGY
jgi:hypothetical protein